MRTPDLVPDGDVVRCQRYFASCAAFYVGHRTEYRMHFSYALGRNLSLDETDEILSRINGYGPHRFEETFAAIERSPDAFWRTPL